LPLELDRVVPAVGLDLAMVVGTERLGVGRADLVVVVAVSSQPSRSNRATRSAGNAFSTLGESATVVAPPSAGAVRQANIITPGNSRV